MPHRIPTPALHTWNPPPLPNFTPAGGMLFQGTKSAFISLRPSSPWGTKKHLCIPQGGKTMFLPSSLGRANFLDSTPSPAGNEKFIGLFQAFFSELRSRKYTEIQSICASKRIHLHSRIWALQGRWRTGAGNKSIRVYKIFSFFLPLPSLFDL